jgi:hypothetical protein
MVYLRRGVADYVEGFQDEMMTVIHPLAGKSCLNKKCEYRFQYMLTL